ncbi:MAG TPA: NADH-quinone oxidoreductase subunit L, partial [Blastocatellia bacterium]|nr:NADH-quinone oxidoreductase subunit L [Blastocatellia bacterium]
MLATIVFAPLVGAVILGLFGRRMSERLIGAVACSTVGISTAASIYVFFARLLPALDATEEARINEHLFTWIKVGSFRADVSFLLDPLSGIYILFVTFVAFWIHVFAIGYMRGDSGYWRFFAYLNLFMFAMLTLVLGDNFLMMFVGWEGVGLCSYLLIGHYYTKGFACDAAKKAFIVNRVGDFGFALGVMLLFLKAGTIFYFDDPSHGIKGAFEWAASVSAEPLAAGTILAGGITTIAVLLFIGATGKSAQIPLFVWLPDAMAGPTPVSALIHAATMVTAGVYMIARASHIYVKAPAALFIIAVVGAGTALFAATIGLAQWDIKKVLAYSTISQLGYMFLACGVGAFSSGIFHVFTHAFFKALLFLGSGSVIIALHHEQDMRRMGGLKKYLPVTFWTMVAGWLAIAGVPLFSGFFSKDEILYSAFATGWFPEPWPAILWAVGAATALLTAVYMTRLMVLTFGGDRRRSEGASHDSHSDDGHATPQESPRVMTVPLIVLAIGAVAAGYVGLPSSLTGGRIPNFIEHLLEHSVARGAIRTAEEGHSTELVLMGVSVLLAFVGIALAVRWFSGKPLWQAPKLLEDKYRIDELYDTLFVRPIKGLSTRLLWKVVDVKIIDGAVNGAGRVAAQAGTALRFLQSGLARSY